MTTDNFTEMFRFICDKKWHDLHHTGDKKVNYCDGCDEFVYRVNSRKELRAVARQGRCVSLNLARLDESEWFDDDEPEYGEIGEIMGDMLPPGQLMGVPLPPDDPTPPPPPSPPPPSNFKFIVIFGILIFLIFLAALVFFNIG